MRRLPGKLTYANVVATIALFIAIGGASAFAASQLGKNSVGAKQLKKDAVTGAKVKNGSLTGSDIKSTSLGVVPSANTATHADSATFADSAGQAANAATADGLTLRKIFYAPATASPAGTPILSLGGLSLSASCSAGTVVIQITSAVDHAHFSSEMFNSSNVADGLHDPDLNTTNSDNLTDGNTWGETSFTYTRPDGTIVNGQVSFDSSNSGDGQTFDGAAACLASGFAISTASG